MGGFKYTPFDSDLGQQLLSSEVDTSLGMWISLVMSYHTTPRKTVLNVCTHHLHGTVYKVFSQKYISNLTFGYNEKFNTEVLCNVNRIFLFLGLHVNIYKFCKHVYKFCKHGSPRP